MKQKHKNKFTQTGDSRRRKTFIATITEEIDSQLQNSLIVKIPTAKSIETNKLEVDVEKINPSQLEKMTEDQYTHKIKRLGSYWSRMNENIAIDHYNSMDLVLIKDKYSKQKRANSFDK